MPDHNPAAPDALANPSRAVASPSSNAWMRQLVTVLRGVGPERAALLARLEITAIEDLLSHRPRRYEDRRHPILIRDWPVGLTALAGGTIVVQGLKTFRRRTQSVFEIVLDDGSGRLHCRWWNQPFREHQFHVGQRVFVYGKLIGLKPRTVDHPDFEVVESAEDNQLHMNRVVPIYPLTEGLAQRWLRALIWQALNQYIIREEQDAVPIVPGVMSRSEAWWALHFPKEPPEAERARQRLALDELLALQREFHRRRVQLRQNAKSIPCAANNRSMKPFLANLGFNLTPAQTRVLREIRKDLSEIIPMRRMLQGDVGSGKTVVGACAILMVLESGHNALLMAPTEILAAQHYQRFQEWFNPLGFPVRLWTGSVKDKEILETRPAGSARESERDPPPIAATANPQLHNPVPRTPQLVIGTHALIEAGFAIEDLGFVLIDEQHKFGVVQREALVRKGHYPHLLLMTATPIPRTLGLTLYGDLDLSVLDEKPARRGPVRTFLRTQDKLPRVWEFVRQKLDQGNQAYVVCPRLGDTEEGDLKAVRDVFEQLRVSMAPRRVGLLHGQLKGEAKSRVMSDFASHALDLVVATSVVEVGLDVPNASVVVILDADRFGLAQLHQIRGRIGRGAAESFCILISESKTELARQRLQTLVETTDGFRIAEADLKFRGPGEFLGQAQSGCPKFRFADLNCDVDLLEKARTLSQKVEVPPSAGAT